MATISHIQLHDGFQLLSAAHALYISVDALQLGYTKKDLDFPYKPINVEHLVSSHMLCSQYFYPEREK